MQSDDEQEKSTFKFNVNSKPFVPPQQVQPQVQQQQLEADNEEQNEHQKNKRRRRKKKTTNDTNTLDSTPSYLDILVNSKNVNKTITEEETKNNETAPPKRSDNTTSQRQVPTESKSSQQQHQQQLQPRLAKRGVITLADKIPELQTLLNKNKKNTPKVDHSDTSHHKSQQKHKEKKVDKDKKVKVKLPSDAQQERAPKKPNKLKKIILNERAQKKQTETGENITSTDHIDETDQIDQTEADTAETDTTIEPLQEQLESDSDTSDQEENTNDSNKRVIPREYVDYELNPALDEVTKQLLTKLREYQSRLYKKEPKKFKAHRRFVLGLREVGRAINAKKIIAIIIAPNIEKISTYGGLDTIVTNLVQAANQQGVPVVYALSKRKIAKIFGRVVKMSVVGIYSADGAYEEFKRMVQLTKQARQSQEEQQQQEQEQQQLQQQQTQEPTSDQQQQQQNTTVAV
jgi:selenocysteine insertion sequence-binding protein 2